jgi:transcriptional regulator with GAF, ATPase, and Fis domain
VSAEQTDQVASSLAMLEGLLDTLTDVLDVREVIDRVSMIAQQVLPHDIMGVLEFSADGTRMRLHVTVGVPAGIPRDLDLPVPDVGLVRSARDAVVIDDVQTHPFARHGPAAQAGMRSAVSAPVVFGGRVQAAVNFFSRQPGRFSAPDLLIAKRIASHLALTMSHRRLAEEAHRRRALEALALLDQSLELLTATGAELFERISVVTRPVLPHDALVLWELSPEPRCHACSGVAAAEVRAPGARDPDWDYEIVDHAPDPAFRSALRVPIRLDTRFAGVLVFLARTPAAFTREHAPIAVRVAHRVTVSVERELSVAATRRADAATDRAARLEARVRALTDELDARTGYRRVIGESRPWRQVLTQATQVAGTETTVLLLGESGTGKEVVARFVHRGSARRDGPFVALNCAALPDNLLEAELFGYERGAFTSAGQSKPGQLEQAAGGVLFLDEVGEMSLAAQAKCLRVLQEREFQRLGGSRVLHADVRIVAATNRDLVKAIERGAFREDLYYRLSVFPIVLPPLRERHDDILAMSEAFVEELGRALGRPPAGLAREARQALLDYPWPGNVRELRNVLERAAILADGGLIVREHLAFVGSPRPAAPDADSSERAAIERALADARFNKAKAARALGLTRAQLYVRLKRHGLE